MTLSQVHTRYKGAIEQKKLKIECLKVFSKYHSFHKNALLQIFSALDIITVGI